MANLNSMVLPKTHTTDQAQIVPLYALPHPSALAVGAGLSEGRVKNRKGGVLGLFAPPIIVRLFPPVCRLKRSKA